MQSNSSSSSSSPNNNKSYDEAEMGHATFDDSIYNYDYDDDLMGDISGGSSSHADHEYYNLSDDGADDLSSSYDHSDHEHCKFVSSSSSSSTLSRRSSGVSSIDGSDVVVPHDDDDDPTNDERPTTTTQADVSSSAVVGATALQLMMTSSPVAAVRPPHAISIGCSQQQQQPLDRGSSIVISDDSSPKTSQRHDDDVVLNDDDSALLVSPITLDGGKDEICDNNAEQYNNTPQSSSCESGCTAGTTKSASSSPELSSQESSTSSYPPPLVAAASQEQQVAVATSEWTQQQQKQEERDIGVSEWLPTEENESSERTVAVKESSSIMTTVSAIISSSVTDKQVPSNVGQQPSQALLVSSNPPAASSRDDESLEHTSFVEQSKNDDPGDSGSNNVSLLTAEEATPISLSIGDPDKVDWVAGDDDLAMNITNLFADTMAVFEDDDTSSSSSSGDLERGIVTTFPSVGMDVILKNAPIKTSFEKTDPIDLEQGNGDLGEQQRQFASFLLSETREMPLSIPSKRTARKDSHRRIRDNDTEALDAVARAQQTYDKYLPYEECRDFVGESDVQGVLPPEESFRKQNLPSKSKQEILTTGTDGAAVSQSNESTPTITNSWESNPSNGRRAGKKDCWERLLFISVVYIMPFTYKAASQLPHVFFLIELRETYRVHLSLAGLFLSLTYIARLIALAACIKTPRKAALRGTIVAFFGYIFMVVSPTLQRALAKDERPLSSVGTVQPESSGGSKIPAVFFVTGSILVGFGEINGALQILVKEIYTSNNKTAMASVPDLVTKQLSVMRFSTIAAYSVGGILYDYLDLSGVACLGALLLLMQFAGLVVTMFLAKSMQISDTGEDENLETMATESEIHAELEVEGDRGFASLVTGDLEPIMESEPSGAESGDEDEKRSQEGGNKSKTAQDTARLSDSRDIPVARDRTPSSGSDAEEDTSASDSEPPLVDSPQDSSNEQETTLGPRSLSDMAGRGLLFLFQRKSRPQNAGSFPIVGGGSAVTEHNPIGWIHYFVACSGSIQTAMNGFIFGTCTLLMFEEFDMSKSLVGVVLAFVAISGVVSVLLPVNASFENIVRKKLPTPHNLYFFLFAGTYLALMSAIPFLAAYLIGALLINLALGLFVSELMELQGKISTADIHEKIAPFGQRTKRVSGLVAIFVTPILYDVLPRLPNIVGSCVCFLFTLTSYIGFERAKCQSRNYLMDRLGRENVSLAGNQVSVRTAPGSTNMRLLKFAEQVTMCDALALDRSISASRRSALERERQENSTPQVFFEGNAIY